MTFLVDSNILLRFTQTSSPQNRAVSNALIRLKSSGEALHIVPQNLIEFWGVCTRPVVNNGLGLSVPETQTEIIGLKKLFTFLDDTPGIFRRWERLVFVHKVLGKNVHDARLVAAMLEHNITHLLTSNVKDFKRFDDIAVVDPADVN